MACGARVVRRGGFNAERRNDAGLIPHKTTPRPLDTAPSFRQSAALTVSQGRADL